MAIEDENWGEGSLKPGPKPKIKLNQYKERKYIDSSGNTYYRRPDVGY